MTKPQIRLAYRGLPGLLKKLRISAGLNQRELAGKLKVAQNTIYRMEVGSRRCDVIELIEWSKACGANPMEVFKIIAATSH